MKQVLDYIHQLHIDLIFEKIDTKINFELINESLKSSILMDLVKQLINKRKNVDDYYSYNTPLFKNLFRYENIQWDKISDSDFEVYEYIDETEADKKSLKLRKNVEKKVRSIIKGNFNNFVLLRDRKSKEFTFFINSYGSMYSCNNGRLLTGSSKKELNITDKMEFVKTHDIYLLDLNKFSSNPIRSKRYNEKVGMINMDEQSFKKIAEDNVRRYKEIIAKHKSERMTKNDTIAEEVQEMVNRALEVTVKYNKDIVKYADLSYKIENLLKLIYNKETYIGHGQSTGEVGLLSAFASYMEYKRSALKNTASNNMYSMHQYDNEKIDKFKTKIEESLEKIDSLINEIESLM
jgi:hypothetical protein